MIRSRALELRVDNAQVQEGYARRSYPHLFSTVLTAGNQKGDRMKMGTLGHLSELVSCTVSNYQRALSLLTGQSAR